MGPEVERWLRAAIDQLGEPPPHPDATHACLAYVDRVMAHASATGHLERVTYRRPTALVGPDGTVAEIAPGCSVLLLDRGGRAYRLCSR